LQQMLCKCNDTSAVAREKPPKSGKHFQSGAGVTGVDSLIWLVPGHGNGWTSQLDVLKRELQQVLPEAQCIISRAGSDSGTQANQLQQDLDAAALALADEVCEISETRLGDQVKLAISFLAMGTGGLIVRAAVPWLSAQLREQLMTFVSVGTPHLGLWFPALSWPESLKLWRLRWPGGPLWCDQITHMDGRRAEGSRLYRLCECDTSFQFFKRVILVGSNDDFVPLWSSLVNTSEPNPRVELNPGRPRSPEVSRANLLVFAIPFLWLVRLRAWFALSITMLVLILTFLWTPPSRALKKQVARVKDTLQDFVVTVQHFRAGAGPNFHELATRLTQHLPHERVLKVELSGGCNRGWSRAGGASGATGLWPQSFSEPQTIRGFVEGYGAYLSA